jgi:hypothetical protein
MAQARTPNSDFNRAFGDAKKQAAGVAGEVSDAAQDLYGQAADSSSQVADATTRAVRKTAVLLRRHCATRLKISHIRLL